MATIANPTKILSQHLQGTATYYIHCSRQMVVIFQATFYISGLFPTCFLQMPSNCHWGRCQLPKWGLVIPWESWRSPSESLCTSISSSGKLGHYCSCCSVSAFQGRRGQRDSPKRGALSFLIISRSKFWEQKFLNYRGKMLDLWKCCLWNHNADMISAQRNFPPIKTAWKLGLIWALTSTCIIALLASVTCLNPQRPKPLSHLPPQKQRSCGAWQGWTAQVCWVQGGAALLHCPVAKGPGGVCGWPWAWDRR